MNPSISADLAEILAALDPDDCLLPPDETLDCPEADRVLLFMRENWVLEGGERGYEDGWRDCRSEQEHIAREQANDGRAWIMRLADRGLDILSATCNDGDITITVTEADLYDWMNR